MCMYGIDLLKKAEALSTGAACLQPEILNFDKSALGLGPAPSHKCHSHLKRLTDDNCFFFVLD